MITRPWAYSAGMFFLIVGSVFFGLDIQEFHFWRSIAMISEMVIGGVLIGLSIEAKARNKL